MSSLLGAVQFLTRVPVRLRRAPSPASIVPWFPVVGALVGGLVAGTAIGLDRVLTSFAAAAAGVLVGVAVTGAFHEDGLADTADAIAGGATPERRREILDDSRLGTYGTAALCGSLLLRVAAVTGLLEVGWQATVGALVTAHAIARVAGVALMAASPSADSGLGATFAAAVTSRRAVVTCGIGCAIGAIATGWWVVPFAAATATVAVIVAVVGRRAFGRLNGDLYGAAEQLAEIAIVLIASGLAASHAIWWT